MNSFNRKNLLPFGIYLPFPLSLLQAHSCQRIHPSSSLPHSATTDSTNDGPRPPPPPPALPPSPPLLPLRSLFLSSSTWRMQRGFVLTPMVDPYTPCQEGLQHFSRSNCSGELLEKKIYLFLIYSIAVMLHMSVRIQGGLRQGPNGVLSSFGRRLKVLESPLGCHSCSDTAGM